MEMKGNHSFGNSSTCNRDIQGTAGDKFMQYSADQVMVLEQIFVECQKPNHAMRLAMIRENFVLSNLDSQQIQAWFENRRSLEQKKKEAFVLFKFLNERMIAFEKLLLLENVYLHGALQQSLRENDYIRKLLQYASLESFLAPEVPRSVFKNVKVVAARRLLLLQNELLHNEVQQLIRENAYIQNLLENIDALTNSDAVVNSFKYSSEVADNSKGLVLFSGTTTKFPPKTPCARDWVSIPRMKFSEGVTGISANTCSALTCFPVSGIIIDASVMLSFVKEAMVPNGTLDLLLHQHQEFVICCSLKDIKLNQISFKDGEKSLTAIIPSFFPLDTKLNQISFKDEEESLTAVISAFPQDIKLDKIASKDREESLTAVVPTFLPQRFRVVVGRYCVLGAWHYVPNGQAASGDVKFMLRFKFVN